MSAALVIDLARAGGAPLATVGGKAAGLGRLLDAGFAVPDGFCITTAAYARAATAAGLDDVSAAVREAYRELRRDGEDDVPVAVRSSATAEDLPDASFAGQQDTFLNVIGTEAVLDAVRRCWASLWTDRAVSYREQAGVDHAGVRLAVVVQRMVDAEVAGVLFTADPVTGSRRRSVVDAAPGLGESVVSGAVNPDHLVTDEAGTVLEQRTGDKRVAVRAAPGGGTTRTERAADGSSCLTADRVRELVTTGGRIQEHLGAPQDVEWAFDTAGTLWLTQSRPITTLHPVPQVTAPGLRVFVCVSLVQGLTRPLTPMGLSAFRVMGSAGATRMWGVPVADPLAGPAVLADAGGRLFVDVTGALRSRVGRAIAPKIARFGEARAEAVLESLFDDPAFSVLNPSRRPLARRIGRLLVRYRVPVLVALALARPAAAHRRIDRVGDDLRRTLRPPATASPADRLDRALRLLGDAIPMLPRVVPVPFTGMALHALALRLASPDADDATGQELLRGLPHNTTTGMDLELWALASRIRTDDVSAAALRAGAPRDLADSYRRGDLPPALQSALAGFLARHGHRAVAEIDLGMPRWSDDPAHLLGVLTNYLRLDDTAPDGTAPDGTAPDAQFARAARAAEAACAAVVERVRRRSRPRAALVGFALRRARQLAGARETHKDYLIRILAAARAELAAVGSELAGRGLLDVADDVFFLDLAQVRSALDGADHRDVVAARREEYRRELRRRHVPRVLLSDGTEPETLLRTTATDPGTLVGSPASAGVVTAPARVVLDPVGAHLEPGEILVAPSTDPGWTPLFLTAGGLVMEMGGPISHGAVVAREYGIPAVVGVPDATTRIRTGDVVTVDGAAGLVRPAPGASS